MADKQTKTKLVESNLAACLDAGSTPAGSTLNGENVPRNQQKCTDNQTIVGAFLFWLYRSVSMLIMHTSYAKGILFVGYHVVYQVAMAVCHVAVRFGGAGGDGRP